jgi:acyl-CoA synthetase (AMP-forming)/AMP-acid ligase II
LSFAENARLRTVVGGKSRELGAGARAVEQGGPVPPVEARGPGTNLGRALREAMPATPSGKIQKFRLREMLRDGSI